MSIVTGYLGASLGARCDQATRFLEDRRPVGCVMCAKIKDLKIPTQDSETLSLPSRACTMFLSQA